MINRDQVINATEAYLIAYDTALSRTKNQDLAVQVATMVTMTVYQSEQQNQPKQLSTGDMFLAAMMQQMQTQQKKSLPPKKKEDSEDDDQGS